MNNFFRAVKIALRYRLTLAIIFGSSLVVAVLWGGNVTAIYPIIEVVFQNKTMKDWSGDQIAKLNSEIDEHRTKIAQYEAALKTAGSDERERIQQDLQSQTSQLELRETALANMVWADATLIPYTPKTPFQTLAVVIAALLIGTIVKDLFIVINMMCVSKVANLATMELREKFYEHTLRMDLAAFGHDRSSNLMTRFTADMGAMSVGVSTLLGVSIREPLKMFACLIGAAIISWRLLLISLIVTPVAAFIIARLSQSIKRANRRAMEEMSQLYGALNETFQSIQIVKAYTMEEHEEDRFRGIAQTYYRRAMKIVRYNAISRPATEIMGMLVICMAILAGGFLVLNNKRHLGWIPMGEPLSLGQIITFFALLISACDPARKLASVLQALQASAAAADRIYELMDRKPAIVGPTNPQPIPEGPLEITFEKVEFSYQDDTPVIKDLYLKIQPGESLAIVGPNGCGKSTLVNLIPRFYDPTAGRILINDVDVREFDHKKLRTRIGLVTQQTHLFDDTIMNNIRYGSLDATDEEVIAAAKQARAHRFIETKLEDGYQTIAGEKGGRLSGGQRQRIVMARAILRDPSILILDEATSQIDVESERMIHEALRKFIAGRTSIMITHRLSTLDLADRIIVMDSGLIADMGTHHELVQRCAVYQSLYSAGFKEAA